MHYVMADIHGEYDKYLAMLDRIGFSSRDALFLLGDLADRHPGGLSVIRHAMSAPNIQVILGNHELMLLQALGVRHAPGADELWSANGGDVTRRELLENCGPDELAEILEWMDHLPEFLELTAGGRAFHLVHGWYGDDTYQRLWPHPRPTTHSKSPLPGKTLLVGHTPVPLLYQSPMAYLAMTARKGKHLKAFHGKGFIVLDCGCALVGDLRRLCCLRLEDMEEFYI